MAESSNRRAAMRFAADRPVTAEENDACLAALLAAHGVTHCPSCGTALDRGALAWNSRATEYGTPFSQVLLHCPACDQEMATASSWFGIAGHHDEEALGMALAILADEWEE